MIYPQDTIPPLRQYYLPVFKPLLNLLVIMPESTANPTGSNEPNKVPFGKWDSFSWEKFPEWEGTKAIMFRSQDGKRVAGAFRESATATMTYPCDEFSYVTAGSIKAHVHGGETFTLKTGDCVYFTKGQTVEFECSEDYANVSVFFGTEPVTIV
jgi:Ethanolamine utilization protein